MDHLSSELKGIPGLEARVHQLNSDERAAQAKLAELKRQMFETDQSSKVSLKRQMKKNYQPSTSCLNSIDIIPFHCRHPAASLQLKIIIASIKSQCLTCSLCRQSQNADCDARFSTVFVSI